MQKKLFMTSMILMSDMVLGMSNLADNMKESVTVKPKKKGEKSTVKIEHTDDAKEILKSTISCFDQIERSIRSFFMANDKEEYIAAKHEDALAMYKKKHMVMSSDVDVLNNAIYTYVQKLQVELKKHKGNLVHHNNGNSWKKNKNDMKRFKTLSEKLEAISKVVS